MARSTSRPIRIGLAGAALAFGFGGIALGCGGDSKESRSSGTISTERPETSTLPLSNARALRVSYVAIPPLPRVLKYQTFGVLPQVSNPGIDLSAVNAALRKAIIDHQRRYTRSILRFLKEMPDKSPIRGTYEAYVPGPNPSNPGLERDLISASTTVVSAIIPICTRLSGQNGSCQGFISVTVQVPSGRLVTIDDLFAKPRHGLSALAVAFRKRAAAYGGCFRSFLRIFPEWFFPIEKNYQQFALTRRGLAIGWPGVTADLGACNTAVATVPYSVLLPYLSKLGLKLVAGVRQPLFKASN